MKTRAPQPKLSRQILDEASAWFVDFRVGDVDQHARERFDQWLRRSPEHIRAYMEIARKPRNSRKNRAKMHRSTRAGARLYPPLRSAQITFFLRTFLTLTGAFFAPFSSSPLRRWPQA